MNINNININFKSLSSATGGIWVNMEQVDLPIYNGKASVDDIVQMSALERAQTTAFSFRVDDGVYFSDAGNVINIPLKFMVYPSLMDLDYSLEIQEPGVLSDRVLTTKIITKNIIVPMSNKVEFPYLIQGASFSWETLCYDEMGNIVPAPNYTIEQNCILFDAIVFGVLRGTFQSIGYKYTATLSFQKEVSDLENQIALGRLRTIINTQDLNKTSTNKITNAECTVLCKYVDDNGEDQIEALELQLPESVSLYLAECTNTGSTKITWPDEEGNCHTTYYYSVCDGSILDITHVGSCS